MKEAFISVAVMLLCIISTIVLLPIAMILEARDRSRG